MGRDPIGEAGGINIYGYVNNEPLNQADAKGLAEVRICDPVRLQGALLLELEVYDYFGQYLGSDALALDYCNKNWEETLRAAIGLALERHPECAASAWMEFMKGLHKARVERLINQVKGLMPLTPLGLAMCIRNAPATIVAVEESYDEKVRHGASPVEACWLTFAGSTAEDTVGGPVTVWEMATDCEDESPEEWGAACYDACADADNLGGMAVGGGQGLMSAADNLKDFAFYMMRRPKPTPKVYDVGLAKDLRANPLKGTQVNHCPQSRRVDTLVGDWKEIYDEGHEPAIRLPTSEHIPVSAAQARACVPMSARQLLV